MCMDMCTAICVDSVHAQGWKDWNGNLLTPERVTLYDCNTYVIKPATIQRRCSFVELVGETAAQQMPKWFVSHWCAPELPITPPVQYYHRTLLCAGFQTSER